MNLESFFHAASPRHNYTPRHCQALGEISYRSLWFRGHERGLFNVILP